MNPILHSIDSLLNRFDELSNRHANFVSNFDTNFTNIENPLHDVARDKEEQRKTAEKLLLAATENDDRMGSFGTVEDFNRRITKSQCRNRPPSYSSNDSSSFFHRVPSRSSFATTESNPLPSTSTLNIREITTAKSNPIAQSIASTSTINLNELKNRFITKIKQKIVPQSPPPTRRYARSAITTFTMETVNRLSRPKTYHEVPDQKVPSKRIHRRSKPYQNIKKETPESSVASVPLSATSQIKRTNPPTIQSLPKKLKTDNKYLTANSKRIPSSNYPRPAIFLAPPPTICLTFPMQPELKSSRVVVMPKPITVPKKTTNILTNKRSIIPPNRMIQLMT